MEQENLDDLPIVEFYTRLGCHLCVEALIGIKKLERLGKLQLYIYDIDKDDELTEEYGLIIPVIKIDGKLVHYGNIDFVEMERNLIKKDTK
ncbi:MAG: glutaredoxin family protein [Bacillales bacterium]|jgi:predicted thioredoxin/glutaredoxin|nr:glutaredoxin family protein [Bacillales bacterium]